MYVIKLKKEPTRNICVPTTIALVSIFKNEGHIIEEWIEHYIKEGVDTFYLIDNGSTDNYIEKIQRYITSGKVILNIDGILNNY